MSSAPTPAGADFLSFGLQSTYEDVARDTNRGHTVAAVGECFQLAKDAGFKVRCATLHYATQDIIIMSCIRYVNLKMRCSRPCAASQTPPPLLTPHPPPHPPMRQVIAHMMPDLPNVGWERDIESFREFFENPAFRTDGLKLYPTLVIRGTGLYELWKRGLYTNYPPEKV